MIIRMRNTVSSSFPPGAEGVVRPAVDALRSESPTRAWYTLNVEALTQRLQTNINVGLTEDEAQKRLHLYGLNVLLEGAPPSPVAVLLRQFSSLIVWVLIGAALVSGLLQEWIDAAAIVVIVGLNAVLGFMQEYQAERSLAALKKLAVTHARVLREGEL